jgi:hypothetical protein
MLALIVGRIGLAVIEDRSRVPRCDIFRDNAQHPQSECENGKYCAIEIPASLVGLPPPAALSATSKAESAAVLVGIAVACCASTAAPAGTGSGDVVGATSRPGASLPACDNVLSCWAGVSISGGALASCCTLCWTSLLAVAVIASEVGGLTESISTRDEGEAVSAGSTDIGGPSFSRRLAKPPRARSGSCGLESSILRKYRLLISAPCSGKSAAAERRCD